MADLFDDDESKELNSWLDHEEDEFGSIGSVDHIPIKAVNLGKKELDDESDEDAKLFERRDDDDDEEESRDAKAVKDILSVGLFSYQFN